MLNGRGSQVSRTVRFCVAAANKVVQCCMLRARMLLSMAAPSVGIAGALSSPRQPPLHPHAHALPSPLSPCACRRLHRGNPPRAMGALPAAGRCEPAQCARRPFMSRRVDGSLWALWSESRCVRSACRYGHAGALRPLCSVPAYPSMQPHCTGPYISPIAGAGQKPILAAYSARVRAHDAVT